MYVSIVVPGPSDGRAKASDGELRRGGGGRRPLGRGGGGPGRRRRARGGAGRGRPRGGRVLLLRPDGLPGAAATAGGSARGPPAPPRGRGRGTGTTPRR